MRIGAARAAATDAVTAGWRFESVRAESGWRGGGFPGLRFKTLSVDESRDVMFACGSVAARKCSVHSMADGNVAQDLFLISQDQPVIYGKYPLAQGAKGALDNNNYNGYGAVAMDPNDNNLLYFVVLSGVIVYEIDTGNSHFMSM